MQKACLALLALVAATPLWAPPTTAGDSASGEPPPGVVVDDTDPDGSTYRPQWADPDASDPPLAVDDDPTPFDPAAPPPSPEPAP